MTAKKPGARRGRPRSSPDLPVDEVIYSAPDPVVEREDKEISDFLSGEGVSVGAVQVWRLTATGKNEFIANVPSDQLNEEFIRDEFGTGNYRLRFKTVGGDILGDKRLSIGRRHSDQPSIPVAGALATAAAANGGDMSVTQLLREQLAQSNAMLLAVMGRKSESDPADLLTAVSNTFLSLRDRAGGAAAAINPLDQMKTVLELAKSLAPRGSGPDPDTIFSVVRDVATKVLELPVVQSALGSMLPAAPGAAGELAPAVNGNGGPAVGLKTVGELVTSKLAYLKGRAALGKDSAIYLDQILENSDEPENGALISAIQQGVTFEDLLKFDVEIRTNVIYRVWFEGLYNALAHEIRNPGNTIGPGGDTPDTPRDADPSAPGLDQTQPAKPID